LGFKISLYLSAAKLQRNGLKPSQFGLQYRHQLNNGLMSSILVLVGSRNKKKIAGTYAITAIIFVANQSSRCYTTINESTISNHFPRITL
jgi:hypothetical protein